MAHRKPNVLLAACAERSIGVARFIIVTCAATKEIAMDNDRIKGTADQAKGTVKEVVGKAIGDQKMQAEGTVTKLTGKVESAVGGATK